jgi:pimeloyl-ACP methyl ester carboxylesterase
MFAKPLGEFKAAGLSPFRALPAALVLPFLALLCWLLPCGPARAQTNTWNGLYYIGAWNYTYVITNGNGTEHTFTNGGQFWGTFTVSGTTVSGYVGEKAGSAIVSAGAVTGQVSGTELTLNFGGFWLDGSFDGYNISGSLSYTNDPGGVYPDYPQLSGTMTLTNNGMQVALPAAEYNALVDLYNATGGDYWYNHFNWLTPDLGWVDLVLTGTQFDSDGNVVPGSAHVSWIQLYDNYLGGSLPDSLANLTSLQHLELGENYFSGDIPAVIGRLTQLQELELDHNLFSGSIPSFVGGLSQLNYLGLNDNQFTGEVPDLSKIQPNATVKLYDNCLDVSPGSQTLANIAKLYAADIRSVQYLPQNAYCVSPPLQITVTPCRVSLAQANVGPTNGIDDPIIPVTDTNLLAGATNALGLGVVADGVTPVLFNIAATATNYTIGIAGDAPCTNGSLASHLWVLQNGKWANSTNLTVSAAGGSAQGTAFAYLQGFNWSDFQGPPKGNEVTLNLTVAPAGTADQTPTVTFKVRPPPVILVHGYNSDSNTWSGPFLSTLQANEPSGFILPVQYGVTYGLLGESKTINTTDPLIALARLLDQVLDGAFAGITADYACTRYDVVAHSQGGLLARMLCQTNYAGGAALGASRPPVSSNDFFRGRFRRVITLGSPHNGSRLLRYLLTREHDGASVSLLAIADFLDYLQPKFDPYGDQMQYINGPLCPMDGRIKFDCLQASIPANVGLLSRPRIYSLTDLYFPAGSGGCVPSADSADSIFQLLIPSDADGIVDLASQGGGAGSSAFYYNETSIAHCPPAALFGVPNLSWETGYSGVASEVNDLLKETSARSFVIPSITTKDECLIDTLATNSVKLDAKLGAYGVFTITLVQGALIVQKPRVEAPALPGLQALGSAVPSVATSCFTCELQAPAGAALGGGAVFWFADLYGSNGIDEVWDGESTNGVSVESFGGNQTSVQVCVDSGTIGTLVLRAVYQSSAGGVVPAESMVIYTNYPGSLNGVLIDPATINPDPGAAVPFRVVGNCTDGTYVQLYVPSGGSIVWSSSNTNVFQVDTNGNGVALASGTATVSATYLGYTAQAAVQVNPPGYVIIVQQPKPAQAPGQTVSFNVLASGSAPLFYQWYSTNGILPGATNSSLFLTNAAATSAGGYFVVVSNSVSTATSAVAALTFTLPGQLFILSNPASQSVAPGQTAALSVGASGAGPVGYHWYFNGSALPGANAPTLYVDNFSSTNAGSYLVVVSNSVNTAISAAAVLTEIFPPQIVTPPASQSVPRGSSASFNVAVSGAPPFACQWLKNGTNLSDGGNRSGSLTTNLTLNPVSTNDAGGYAVILANSYGSITSSVAALTVFVDVTPPTLAITNVTTGMTVSNAAFTVRGVAHDNQAVASVFYSLNQAAWVNAATANHWSNWSASVTLAIGTNTIAAYAVDTSGNRSATNTVNVIYVVVAPLKVSTNGLGSLTPNDNGALLQIGRSYAITAAAATGFAFNNWTGGTSLPLSALTNGTTVQFKMASNWMLQANFLDIQKPVLSITAPTAGQRVSNAVFTVKGAASDNWAVSNVWLRLNSNTWSSATGTNWSASEALTPGTNSVQAYAVDTSGNHSTTNSVTFDFVVTNQLGLHLTGLGTLSPNDSNAWLEVGRNYAITATPATGFIFTNWTLSTNWQGGVTTNKATVQFMMASNLTLTANFVETTKPVLAITNLPASQRTSNTVIAVKGTAGDNWRVMGVWCQLNSNTWLSAVSTNNFKNWFTTNLTLSLGTNLIKAYALDLGGNYSLTNSVAVVVTNAPGLRSASVRLLVLPASVSVADPHLTPGGLEFTLQITGAASGIIQASTNLTSWETLSTFTGTNTTINFRDPSAANSSLRFYRAVVP